MNREILFVVDAVAREKGVDKEVIFSALEAALVSASKKKYGQNFNIRVSIDRKLGTYETSRYWDILADDDEELPNPEGQMHLRDALLRDAAAVVGGVIEEPLPPVEFGRIAAQTAKQVIVQKVREAERDQVVSDYVLRRGELVSGVIKRMERGSAIVDLGRTEAVLLREDAIPRESMRPGDRVRAYLHDVRRVQRGPQLFLSRIAPELLIKLFSLEVPEITNGLVEIKAAARDPGARAKIAVKSNDSRLDPVGACVGLRGSRVQAVTNELAGERVDIVVWSADPATFVINALAPAEVTSIVVDEDLHSMDVVVDQEQLSQAIGRGGQNVRLASQLTGWEINIMTDVEAGEKREKEFGTFCQRFVEDLDVDEDLAGVLVQEGFTSVEEIAYVPAAELLQVEGFDEDMVNELRRRARDVLLNKAIAKEEMMTLDDADPALLNLAGMDAVLAKTLVDKGVKSLDDLADLSVEELQDLAEMTSERARELIMAARAHWFAEEDAVKS